MLKVSQLYVWYYLRSTQRKEYPLNASKIDKLSMREKTMKIHLIKLEDTHPMEKTEDCF